MKAAATRAADFCLRPRRQDEGSAAPGGDRRPARCQGREQCSSPKPPARASAAASTTRNCPFAAHSAGCGALGPAQRQRHHPRPLQQRLHQPGRGAVGELARPRARAGPARRRAAARPRRRPRAGRAARRRRRTPARSPGPRPRAGRRRAACRAGPAGGGVPRSSRTPGVAVRPTPGRRPRCRRSSRRRGRAPPGRRRRAGPAGRQRRARRGAPRRAPAARRSPARPRAGGSAGGTRRPAQVDAPGARCPPPRAPSRAHQRPPAARRPERVQDGRRRVAVPAGDPGARDGGGTGRIEASRRA